MGRGAGSMTTLAPSLPLHTLPYRSPLPFQTTIDPFPALPCRVPSKLYTGATNMRDNNITAINSETREAKTELRLERRGKRVRGFGTKDVYNETSKRPTTAH